MSDPITNPPAPDASSDVSRLLADNQELRQQLASYRDENKYVPRSRLNEEIEKRQADTQALQAAKEQNASLEKKYNEDAISFMAWRKQAEDLAGVADENKTLKQQMEDLKVAHKTESLMAKDIPNEVHRQWVRNQYKSEETDKPFEDWYKEQLEADTPDWLKPLLTVERDPAAQPAAPATPAAPEPAKPAKPKDPGNGGAKPSSPPPGDSDPRSLARMSREDFRAAYPDLIR